MRSFSALGVAPHKFAATPPGTARVDIGRTLSNNYVKFDWSFAPKGAGGEFDIVEVLVGWSGEHQALRFWGASLFGQDEGTVEVEGNALVLNGKGYSFEGKPGSFRMTHTLDGDKLVWHQTETKDGEKNVPDEKMTLTKRGGAAASKGGFRDKSSDELLEEVQGSWRLDQAGGRWTVKTIEGNKSKLTRYHADGSVRAGHETEFKLTQTNGIKFYRSITTKPTAGPDTGAPSPPVGMFGGYVYSIEDGGQTWVEARGLMSWPDGKARVLRWKKVKDTE